MKKHETGDNSSANRLPLVGGVEMNDFAKSDFGK